MGTSSATGCGLVAESFKAAEPGRTLVSEVSSVSESLTIGDIERPPVKQNLRFAHLETPFPGAGPPFLSSASAEKANHSTRVPLLAKQQLFARTGANADDPASFLHRVRFCRAAA
jgi:hypothetical protein